MAGMMKPVPTTLIAAVLIVAAVVPRGEAIGCQQVVAYLQPCVPYVEDKGPIGKCCDGVKQLTGVVTTTPEKQGVCNCLKSLGANQPGVNIDKIKGLPTQCGVDAPYIEITPDIDCTKIQ